MNYSQAIQDIESSGFMASAFKSSRGVGSFDECNLKILFNPFYTGRLPLLLDGSMCHFRGVGSILLLYSIFDGKSC